MKQNGITKEDFLTQLRHHLRQLPQEEIDNAMAYYEEYLDEAGEDQLEETLNTLGIPSQIAANIRANRTMQELEESPPSAKKGVSALWVVILGVFALPIALPLAIAAASVIIAVAIVLFALLVAGVAVLFSIIAAVAAVCIGMALGGILGVCVSIPLFFQHIPTGFFYLGCGLAAAGIGMLLFPCLVGISKASWKACAAFFGHHLPRGIARLRKKREQ